MNCIYKIVSCSLLAFLMLSAKGQKIKPLVKKDTSALVLDSLKLQDSIAKKDTLRIKYIQPLPSSYIKADAWYFEKLQASTGDSNFDIFKAYKNYFTNKQNGYRLYIKKITASNNLPALFKIEQRFAVPDKDLLFYLILGVLLMYGLINNIFPQYYSKLFNQFSQSSIRDLQNREQLIQNSFASLISNIGFIISFSLMATLLIFNNHLLPIAFWLAFLYICVFFTLLYFGKFLCLQLVGFVFNVRELVNTYVFVVFMINKVLGILLIPFVLMLAFSKPAFYAIAVGGSAILTLLLFLYRYLFSLTSVRNKLHISSFHFFLYLCAFEILPLLILYKFIVQFLGGKF